MFFGSKRIFMDYAGGEVNPSGIHKEGLEAKKRLEDARAKVAQILKCQARDIVFTSGGTESNNLAIQGTVKAAREKAHTPHIVIGLNEHPSVEEPARELERWGVEVSFVPTDKIISSVKESTVLVSLAYANNETGEINNVPKIARLIRDIRHKKGGKYPLIHTDASAAYEYLEVDINKVPADLLTIEKILVVRPNVEIRPLLLGGGQERGLRAGTENVAAIEAFAQYLDKAASDRAKVRERLMKLKDVFITEVEKLPGIVINTPEESLPNIVSVSFPGKLHEFLAIKLDERGVAVSTGSSCDSSKNEPDKEALRFSLSEKTSVDEVRKAAKILMEILEK